MLDLAMYDWALAVWIFFDFICENPSRPGRGRLRPQR